ncbi:MAG: hypothetical protein ACL7AY_14060 [Candidatus Arsenophonus phytopathogenicus]
MRYNMAAIQKHLEALHKERSNSVFLLFYCGDKSHHPYWLDCFSGRDPPNSFARGSTPEPQILPWKIPHLLFA